MPPSPLKQQILVELIGARDELDDALRLTAPGARYDPVILPQSMRNELSAMRDDLDRIIRALEGQ